MLSFKKRGVGFGSLLFCIVEGYWKFGGETVKAGGIIVRQRGTKIHPSTNVGIGSDDTLYSLIEGKVKFEIMVGGKKRVSVYEA